MSTAATSASTVEAANTGGLRGTEAAMLLQRLKEASDKNAAQVVAVNSIAHFAGGGDDMMEALMGEV